MIKNNAHATSIDIHRRIKGAYIFDNASIIAIEENIDTLFSASNVGVAEIRLEGDVSIKGSSLSEILNHVLISQRPIRGFSLDRSDYPEYFKISVDNFDVSIVARSEKYALYLAASDGIERAVKNCRPWYSFIYNEYANAPFFYIMRDFLLYYILKNS